VTSDDQTPVDADVVAFRTGQLIVYPTEAVMGLGCDPSNEEAVLTLLALKQRSVEQGLILIASNYSQLLPYINDNAVLPHRRTEIFSSWPGPNTWLLPKSAKAPDWISGDHDTIAVRVTNHPIVKSLCDKLNSPLVSTSANLHQQPPAKSVEEAKAYFADQVHYINGDLGGALSPSTIRDGNTGTVIRE
jgi:L-threonylcarbamoyladenylate synthase